MAWLIYETRAVTLFTLLESLVFCFGIIVGVYLLDRLTRVLFFFLFLCYELYIHIYNFSCRS